jgi:hypothetical protein
MANVCCWAVELAYGARPFEVTSASNQLDVQLRSNSEMFYKEQLVNLTVQHWPSDWQYGGYVDGDFQFTNLGWALEAIHLLQHWDFVQLFSQYHDLTGDKGHTYRQANSFAWNYTHQDEFVKKSMGGGNTPDPYYGQLIDEDTAPKSQFPFGLSPGAPGGAWGWTRKAFESVGGMLDTCIMGSGDWWMAFGLANIVSPNPMSGDMTIRSYNESIRAWQRKAVTSIEGNIGCVPNVALHSFHGDYGLRQYGTREQVLKNFSFNPLTDLTRNGQGVYEWAGNKPGLVAAVRQVSLDRREDDGYRK